MNTQDALVPLIEAIIDLADRRGKTPVLVTPVRVTLQPIFFSELATALWQPLQRPIRFDWCRQFGSGVSFLSDRFAKKRTAKINRSLRRSAAVASGVYSMQIAAMIGRPGGNQRHFVVGIDEDQQELPDWCTAIHLASAPTTMIQGKNLRRQPTLNRAA